VVSAVVVPVADQLEKAAGSQGASDMRVVRERDALAIDGERGEVAVKGDVLVVTGFSADKADIALIVAPDNMHWRAVGKTRRHALDYERRAQVTAVQHRVRFCHHAQGCLQFRYVVVRV
jgi:hypothetical protein